MIYSSIEKGLDESRFVVLCLSPAALESNWVGMERSATAFRATSSGQRRLIPLLLEECEIPAALADIKYLDFRSEAEREFRALVHACRGGTPVDAYATPEEELLGTWIGHLRQSQQFGGQPLKLQFDFWYVEKRDGIAAVIGEAVHPPIDDSLPEEWVKYRCNVEARAMHGVFWKIDYRQTSGAEGQPGYGTFYFRMDDKPNAAPSDKCPRVLSGNFVGYGEHTNDIVFGDIRLNKVQNRRSHLNSAERWV
jgi:hypothetical protein